MDLGGGHNLVLTTTFVRNDPDRRAAERRGAHVPGVLRRRRRGGERDVRRAGRRPAIDAGGRRSGRTSTPGWRWSTTRTATRSSSRPGRASAGGTTLSRDSAANARRKSTNRSTSRSFRRDPDRGPDGAERLARQQRPQLVHRRRVSEREHAGHVGGRDPAGGLARARVAEAPGPDRDPPIGRRPPRPTGNPTTCAAAVQDVERDRAPAVGVVRRPVAADRRRPVGVAERRRDSASSRRVRACTRRWIVSSADGLDVAEPDLDRRQRRGSRSCRPRTRCALRQVWRGRSTDATPIVPPANHGRRSRASASRRTTREPTPVGIAENLVPGDGDEVGLPARQVERVRRDEGRRIEQHIPAAILGGVDPVEGGGRPSSSTAPGRRRGGAPAGQPSSSREDGRSSTRSSGARAAGTSLRRPRAGELADPVDRVVVVGGQEQPAASRNGYASPTSLKARWRSP